MRRNNRVALCLVLGGAASWGCTGDIADGAGAGATTAGVGGGATGEAPRGPGTPGVPGVGVPGATPGTTPGTGTPATMAPRPATCPVPTPGASPLRRLTHREYASTVRALLGDMGDVTAAFPPEEEVLGFDNNAEARGTTGLLAEQYVNAAEALAARAVANLPKLLGCSFDGANRDPCARQFIESLGKRAFRRPLDATESARLLKVYGTGRDKWGFDVGISLALQAVLLSPHFLYRVEWGTAPVAGAKTVPLSGFELASRLSYLLWSGPPDDDLVRAAEAGKLTTREQVAEQAQRMLKDARARATMIDFHRQWLDLDKIERSDKNPMVFKTYTFELRALLRKETETFVDNVVWTGKGDLATLLTAPYSLMNAKVAAYYGVKGPASETFEMVTLDPKQRAGLLTQAGILAAHAHADQTSPVDRGLFVRRQFLCMQPPPPPPDTEIMAPKLDAIMTTRERFAKHSLDPACGACHRLMDPIGLGFENFDGAGQWRASENGKAIDATGELVATDVDGRFNGAGELGGKLAGSKQVADCVATQWFRYAYGREATAADTCSSAQLSQRLAASGGNIRDLAVALTQTDAFLYRNVVTPAGGTP